MRARACFASAWPPSLSGRRSESRGSSRPGLHSKAHVPDETRLVLGLRIAPRHDPGSRPGQQEQARRASHGHVGDPPFVREVRVPPLIPRTAKALASPPAATTTTGAGAPSGGRGATWDDRDGTTSANVIGAGARPSHRVKVAGEIPTRAQNAARVVPDPRHRSTSSRCCSLVRYPRAICRLQGEEEVSLGKVQAPRCGRRTLT